MDLLDIQPLIFSTSHFFQINQLIHISLPSTYDSIQITGIPTDCSKTPTLNIIQWNSGNTLGDPSIKELYKTFNECNSDVALLQEIGHFKLSDGWKMVHNPRYKPGPGPKILTFTKVAIISAPGTNLLRVEIPDPVLNS